MNTEHQRTGPAVAEMTDAICPACGGGEMERFFEILDLPVSCVALCATREAAVSCPRAGIRLGFCRRCGAISNLVFDAGMMTYDPSYDNSLHFSAAFQNYASETARDLVTRHNLFGKMVVDVGCGNAEFLSLMCGLGNCRGFGFDPAFIPGRADLDAGKGISITQDYYSERYGQHAADFLICRHVLEHIAKPRQFLCDVRTALAEKSDAAVFFEVPNAAFTFQRKGIWDIIYEHCIYYSAGALARLFSSCGFDVLSVSETFNGQYLCLEARVTSEASSPWEDKGDDLDSTRADILKFAEEYRCCRNYWARELVRFGALGKRVVLWGAGAKGAMFLNTFPDINFLDYIIDINPHKCGYYVPGTGQQVVSPDFLKMYRPDVLLIANPNYRDEISRRVSALGIAPILLTI